MRILQFAVLLIGSAVLLPAAPITITYQASGAGSLNGASFASSTFVITALGDTTNRATISPGTFAIDHGSASINITGLGTFSFTTPTRTFVNQGAQVVGFSRAGEGGSDLLNSTSNAAYSTWDLLSSIGPITGSGSLVQWGLTPVVTSGGTLVFTDRSTTLTFRADVGNAIPEPGTFQLIALGLLGAGLLTRFRRK